jgi:hypothetical protein
MAGSSEGGEAAASEAPKGRVPDFFVVGNPKSGTTALYKMLREHPQIFMPDFKEPRFFASDAKVRAPKAGKPVVRPRTLEAYMALFAEARPDQLAGDGSPQYLRSPEAAQRIAAQRPDARIIAILREPASYLRSYHMDAVKSNLENERDLGKAMALEPERRAGRRLPPGVENPAWLLYSEHVQYLEHLRRFEAVFPSEQILVLIYDDYRRDSEATVKKVLAFLGVDQTIPLRMVETERERLQGVRFLALHRITRAIKIARHRPDQANPLLASIGRLAPRAATEAWRRLVYTEPRQPAEDFLVDLRRRLKPEVAALGEHLGRDLVSLWGYQDL